MHSFNQDPGCGSTHVKFDRGGIASGLPSLGLDDKANRLYDVITQSLRLKVRLVISLGSAFFKHVSVFERFDANQIIVRTSSYRVLNAIVRNRTILGLRESTVARVGSESFWILDVETNPPANSAAAGFTSSRSSNNSGV